MLSRQTHPSVPLTGPKTSILGSPGGRFTWEVPSGSYVLGTTGSRQPGSAHSTVASAIASLGVGNSRSLMLLSLPGSAISLEKQRCARPPACLGGGVTRGLEQGVTPPKPTGKWAF